MADIDTPMMQALRAYGIDPKNTPREALIDHAEDGITIDQFQRSEDGDYLINDERTGVLTERVFYPHPEQPESRSLAGLTRTYADSKPLVESPHHDSIEDASTAYYG